MTFWPFHAGNFSQGSGYFFLRVFYFVTLLSFSSWVRCQGQVTITINKLPESTPADDTLYIAGSFNNWDPGDQRYVLQKNRDGTHSITLPKELRYFQYKITRGSWSSVEGDINGKKLADRSLSVVKEGPQNHFIQVLSWEDMTLFLSWNIIVKEIPQNTPFDAPLFVSGSFNEWKENDHEFRLVKLEDGSYAIKIPKTGRDTIWFKFHRGSWASVESRQNGKTQYNRMAVWHSGERSTNISCNIAAWEDIGGSTGFFFNFLLIASAIQALVLIVSLLSVRKANRKLTNLILLLLFITAVACLAKLTTYNRNIFSFQPKLVLLMDIAYFTFGPALYILVTRITGIAVHWKFLKWLSIAAVAMHAIVYLPLLAIPKVEFVFDSLDLRFNNLFFTAALAASLYNAYIFAVTVKVVIVKYRSSKNYGAQSYFSYLLTLLTHAGALMFLWLLADGLYFIAPLIDDPQRLVHEAVVDLVWILFAVTPYVHTFLLVRKPELFRIKDEADEKHKSSFHKENLESLKETLGGIMRKQKPYLSSKLAIQDLAEAMNVNVHTLSWIINDGYSKNFFDFINEYRIEEFKRLAASDQYKSYTFLAIAMEVGFSSKTTFNRAFKKSTGKTPREYFNNEQESKLEGITE